MNGEGKGLSSKIFKNTRGKRKTVFVHDKISVTMIKEKELRKETREYDQSTP